MRSLRRRRPCCLFFTCLAALALAADVTSPLAAAEPSADRAAITARLKADFDTPDVPLLVDPVVVRLSYAVAGWRQGARGGRALLRKSHQGAWQVVLCSGDPLRHAEGLAAAGVSATEANDIAAALAEAEARLDPHSRHLLSTFAGTVDPPHHSHSD